MTPEDISIAGVVLAGGLARRMGGGDKPLRLVAGQPLLDRVLARLRPQCAQIAINANGDPARFAAYGLPVIADETPDFPGPLAGVLAGLRWGAATGASHVLSVAGDTPFFPADLAPRLAAAIGPGAPIALAATPDPERGMARHPTFGLWPVALADDLAHALTVEGLRKVVLWTDRHGAVTAPFPVGDYDPFFNVNAPDDMAEAERIAREHEF